MPATLKERVEKLEAQVGRLTAAVVNKAPGRTWESTFGLSANDPGFEEMIRLGRDLRQKDRPREDADAGA